MTATWNQTDTFSIESATSNNNLYANGRQSIKVRIAIKVADVNNKPATLSDRERSSIRLVNFHGGKEIKFRDANTTSPVDPKDGDWDWSRVNIGDYQYFPVQGSFSKEGDGSGSLASDTYYVDAYVRCVSQTPITLGVQIKRDDGQLFESVGGNGRLELSPVSPPVYNQSKYQLEKVTITESPGNLTGRSGLFALHYYRLVFVTPKESLQFKSVSLNPGGIYFFAPNWGDLGYLGGFTQPGSRQISYLYTHAVMPSQLELIPAPGEIIFVEAGVVGGPAVTIYKGASGKTTPSCIVSAMDVYGNSHQINLRFGASTSWQIELY
jgi:hypothetical protein